MGRRDDLEQLIRESYGVIHDYEQIVQTSDRPDEVQRARYQIEEQWEVIRDPLVEYLVLCRKQASEPPEDIVEIAAHFGPELDQAVATRPRPILTLDKMLKKRTPLYAIGGLTVVLVAATVVFLVVRPDKALHWNVMGLSAEGRDIQVGTMGDPRGSAVVMVGSIQGDQTNTRDLVDCLAQAFEANPDSLRAGVSLHFIPSINPDGNAANTRRNAYNVDLNRNWDTFDWTADPRQPEGIVEGAGGSRPMSEPETQALSNYLIALQRQNPELRVVVWHNSRLLTGSGDIYPGYTSHGLDPDAIFIARRYAGVSGYAVKETWVPYQTTGELITWCAEQGIPAIDVTIPRSLLGDDADLCATSVAAVLAVARFP